MVRPERAAETEAIACVYLHRQRANTLLVNALDWEIVCAEDCAVTFQKVVKTCEVFIVAGGQEGAAGSAYDQTIIGGKGGNGGGRVTATVSVAENTAYPITVGKSGQASSAFGYTAESGSGSVGGNGASIPSVVYPTRGSAAQRGGDGEYAFGTPNTLYAPGCLYGAGGGGGGVHRTSNNGNTFNFAAAPGGNTGGGAGGAASVSDINGGSGNRNTGAGGGGGNGRIVQYTYSVGAGGAGGSGIVIIRNART